MPQGIVHLLETVKVNKQDRHHLVIATGPGQHLGQTVLQQHPVGQAGQAVKKGQTLNLLRCGAPLGNIGIQQHHPVNPALGILQRCPHQVVVATIMHKITLFHPPLGCHDLVKDALFLLMAADQAAQTLANHLPFSGKQGPLAVRVKGHHLCGIIHHHNAAPCRIKDRLQFITGGGKIMVGLMQMLQHLLKGIGHNSDRIHCQQAGIIKLLCVQRYGPHHLQQPVSLGANVADQLLIARFSCCQPLFCGHGITLRRLQHDSVLPPYSPQPDTPYCSLHH